LRLVAAAAAKLASSTIYFLSLQIPVASEASMRRIALLYRRTDRVHDAAEQRELATTDSAADDGAYGSHGTFRGGHEELELLRNLLL